VPEEVKHLDLSSRSEDGGGAEECFAEKPAGPKKGTSLKPEDLIFGLRNIDD
jgi:hypothetical protein